MVNLSVIKVLTFCLTSFKSWDMIIACFPEIIPK